ncbi:MAG: hypothetical protein QNJ17_05065 [Desulfocapsaceae bacterium]|nr:hypothetical protein [Desulfocapsaceae bacterium]
MGIDIEQLTYEELLELNHRIVERLKFLDSMNTHQEMSNFNPGDEVSFSHPTQGVLSGTLLKYNKKTVTMVTSSGQKWNVSPHLLRKVISSRKGKEKKVNIIDIKRK